MAGWEFPLLRRNSPTPSESSVSSNMSVSSMPVIYDSNTSRLELAPSWDDVHGKPDLVEAEANGKSLNAELKLNVGSESKPIWTHFAWVDMSRLNAKVRNERRHGRINFVFVRV